MADTFRVNASADVGGRFSGPDLGEFHTESTALWSVVLWLALVFVIVAIWRSIR